MDGSTKELLQQAFEQFPPQVWPGLATFVVVLVLEVILTSHGIITFRGERKLKKAKELGHVVTGIRTSWQQSDTEEGGGVKYYARYEYEVNGKKYKGLETTILNAVPPETLDFYWVNSPGRAFTELQAAKKPGMVLLYIIPFLAAVAVMKALGFPA